MCEGQAQKEEVVDGLGGCTACWTGARQGTEYAVEVTVEGDVASAQLEDDRSLPPL